MMGAYTLIVVDVTALQIYSVIFIDMFGKYKQDSRRSDSSFLCKGNCIARSRPHSSYSLLFIFVSTITIPGSYSYCRS